MGAKYLEKNTFGTKILVLVEIFFFVIWFGLFSNWDWRILVEEMMKPRRSCCQSRSEGNTVACHHHHNAISPIPHRSSPPPPPSLLRSVFANATTTVTLATTLSLRFNPWIVIINLSHDSISLYSTPLPPLSLYLYLSAMMKALD